MQKTVTSVAKAISGAVIPQGFDTIGEHRNLRCEVLLPGNGRIGRGKKYPKLQTATRKSAVEFVHRVNVLQNPGTKYQDDPAM